MAVPGAGMGLEAVPCALVRRGRVPGARGWRAWPVRVVPVVLRSRRSLGPEPCGYCLTVMLWIGALPAVPGRRTRACGAWRAPRAGVPRGL